MRSIIAEAGAATAQPRCLRRKSSCVPGSAAQRMYKTLRCCWCPPHPLHYLIAQMQADPVALNRNLGEYTNFVNLLDYAALSVPSSLRADGLPLASHSLALWQRLSNQPSWPALPPGQRLAVGATDQRLPAPQPIAGLSTSVVQSPVIPTPCA